MVVIKAKTDVGHISGPSVQEIHVDFLLWEELQANSIFLEKFVEACVGPDDFDSLWDIKHSLSNHLGESDLVLRYRSKSGNLVGILIEDKIGAAFQPDQASRYRKRGELGIPDDWKNYITCLIAPEKYISRGHDFMEAISLELISKWIDGPGPREKFKLAILNAAIIKEQQTGVQQVDEVITKFRKEYFDLLRQSQTKLNMKPPKPAWKGEVWFKLTHPNLPNKAYIHHKADRGYVDLTFPNVNAVDLLKIENRLEYGMSIEQTGKSTAIRITVPAIKNFDDFSAQVDLLHSAYEAAMRLGDFIRREWDIVTNITEHY